MKKYSHVKFGVQLSEERLRELDDAELEARRNYLANKLEFVEDGARIARSQVARTTYELDRLDVLPAYKQVLEEMRRRGLIKQ